MECDYSSWFQFLQKIIHLKILSTLIIYPTSSVLLVKGIINAFIASCIYNMGAYKYAEDLILVGYMRQHGL
jgi:hypothetical protein